VPRSTTRFHGKGSDDAHSRGCTAFWKVVLATDVVTFDLPATSIKLLDYSHWNGSVAVARCPIMLFRLDSDSTIGE
jgi:hypothetical protein